MSGKQLGGWIAIAVVSAGVLVFADQGLRARSGWIAEGKPSKSGPFLADAFVTARLRGMYLSKEVEEAANRASTPDQRAELLLRATGALRDAADSPERIRLLQRIVNECPYSLLAVDAQGRLIREKIAQTPPASPTAEIARLVTMINTFGLGEGKISPQNIQDIFSVLQAKYPDDAQTLKAAIDTASSGAPAETKP